jgi:hypothetical protein
VHIAAELSNPNPVHITGNTIELDEAGLPIVNTGWPGKVRVELQVVRETEKACLCRVVGRTESAWLPKAWRMRCVNGYSFGGATWEFRVPCFAWEEKRLALRGESMPTSAA